MNGLTQGAKIGNYVLEHVLGEGGQGSVWQARATSAAPGSPPVALKVVFVRGSSHVMVERLRREAQALIRLSNGHPSLVACHGIIEDEAMGVFAVIMDKVEGTDLQAVLEDPRCDARAKEIILMHIARGLAHLHESGFVHRDIKPQNILVTNQFFVTPNDEATVKLVDFGIAVPILNPKPLTEVGTVIGTPGYMSPERIDPLFWQARPGLPTEDVWAFGVVAYEAFFGKHPTGVLDDEATLASYAERYRSAARAQEPWPPMPANHPWAHALHGALALRAAERFPTGAAVVTVVLGGAAAAARIRTEAQLPAPLALATPAVADVPAQRTEVAPFAEPPRVATAVAPWQVAPQNSQLPALPAPYAAHESKRPRALVATLATALVLGTVALVGVSGYVVWKGKQSAVDQTPVPDASAVAPMESATVMPVEPGAPDASNPVHAALPPVGSLPPHHEGAGGHPPAHTTKPGASAPPIVNIPTATPTATAYKPPEITLPPILWPQQPQPQPVPQPTPQPMPQPTQRPPAPQQPTQQPTQRPPVIRFPPIGGGATTTTPTSGGRPTGGRPPPPGGGLTVRQRARRFNPTARPNRG